MSIDQQEAKKQIDALVQENQRLRQALQESQFKEQVALAEARRHKLRLEGFMEQAPAAICVLDGPEMVFELVNPAFRQLYPGRDLLGKSVLEALPEIAGGPFYPVLQQVYQARQTFEGKEIPFPLTRHEGGPLEEVYFNFIYQARLDGQGKADGILAFGYQVTDLVLARKQVEESQLKFKMHSQAIPQLLWTADPEGYVDYYNAQWYTYTGLDFEQSKGQGWIRVVHPEDLVNLAEHWKRALQTGEPYQTEARLKRGDGVYRWFLIRALPLKEEGGQIKQWFGTDTDIHQLKAAEEALQQKTEELASANEELTAASEEIQAGAEELAASNEELRVANQLLLAGEEELRQALEQTVELNEKLSGQERFLSSVLDQSPFATWIADQTGTAIRMNEACRQLFGLEAPSQALGKYNILKDDTLKGHPFFKDIQAVFWEGKIARFELDYDASKVHMIEVPTGKPVRVILTLFPVTNTQGSITNVVVQAEDITDRRQIESALAYQHLLTKTITDNATSCLFMMDKRGYCTFMNPAGEKMFGYSFEEIRQKPLHYMIHHHRPDGSFYPLEECPIDRALPENFDIRTHQDVFFRKDGSSFPVSCAASPIFEEGVPVSTVIEVRDISQEKSAQAALLEMNQALSRKNQDLEQVNTELDRTNKDLDNFVYTASHDLKAPILNIEGLLKAMERQLSKESRQKESVQQIYQLLYDSVNRFRVTIGDLTEVARISKESQEDIASLSLHEVLEEVTQDLRSQIEQAQAKLEVNLNCGPVSFSRKNLKSLLYNLLSNAVKYRSPDRELLVRISCWDEVSYQVLTVEDNGLGMDMRQEDKIFGLFKRLHAHVEGTGIGLYIVKKMIENAGGKIKVESQVGVGSTFQVYFLR